MRRVWHVLTGSVCITINALWEIDFNVWGTIALSIAALGFFVDFKRFKSDRLNRKFERYFGPLLRKSERLSFSGLPFYALGVGVSCFAYSENTATLAILFLIFADPMASIFGVYYGKDRLLPNKTLQGTIAAFITCFVVTIIYLSIIQVQSHNIIIFTFLVSIFGALSELLSAFNIDDNLTIPVVSGLAITVLNFYFQIF
jgi:dolichol kinase